jgi:hypothetical protein
MKFVYVLLAILLLSIIWAGPSIFDSSDTKAPEPIPAPIQFHPNAVAKQFRFDAFDESDGAIVCPTLDDVELVMHGYTAHAEDTLQDLVTHGQDALQRGPTAPVSDMSLFGCTLLPKGTPIQTHQQFGAALAVTGYLPDGTLVQGVTHFGMVSQETH